ncbi:MAG: cobalamin-binding protein [Anaerolineae bacterium]|nr:cobalamin-binding protein [Anaerolineae bacterium]
MKKLVSMATIILVVILLTGCCCPVPVPPTAEPTSQPVVEPTSVFITVEDDVGNAVTLDAVPERIISLAPSHTETLYALGLGDKVVGVTEYCNYPPEAAEKPKVGSFTTIDLEQVVGLEPDLVLATTMHMAETVPALQERGITVFVIDPQTVSDVLDAIGRIGQITGQQETADALVVDVQARIDAVQERVKGTPRPKVFWELGAELYTVGPNTFIDDLITLAGGENVAADADTPWPQLSVEAIILKDPDVIVLADHNYGQTAEMVKERPGWEDIRAVKEGHIIEIVDDDIVSRPGPRLVEGVEFLAQALHPDLFE